MGGNLVAALGAAVAIIRELPDVIRALNETFGRNRGTGPQKKARAVEDLQALERQAHLIETPELVAARDALIEAELAYMKAAEGAAPKQ